MYSCRDVVLYVLQRLGEVESIKKLTLLLLLVQYDVRRCMLTSRKRVTVFLFAGEPITRARYRIMTFGIVSDEIYSVVDQEIDRGVIVVEHGMLPRLRLSCVLDGTAIPPPVLQRIDKVLRKWGGKPLSELEEEVLKLFELEYPYLRKLYAEKDIEAYLRERGFKLVYVDLFDKRRLLAAELV